MSKLDGSTLHGVSETALFTLWCRASEAARPDTIIDDPQAVQLLNAIDYPFRQRFGDGNQIYALRSLTFDAAERAFLRQHPDGTIVALAEGLQTSYWRLGRPECPWISVDFDSVMTLREQVLPREAKVKSVAGSALDMSWAEHVRPGAPTLITAEGLLYYLSESQALQLIEDCARHLPGAKFTFDSVPRWWANRKHKAFNVRSVLTNTRTGADGYVIPPMPFGISPAEIQAFPKRLSGVASARQLSPPPGRGPHGRTVQAGYSSPLIPNSWRFAITQLQFHHGAGKDPS